MAISNNPLIPSKNLDYEQARIMSINCLEYVWEIFEKKIEFALKLIQPTMEEERFNRISVICKQVLHANIVKQIVDTKNATFLDNEELKGHEEALYSRFITQPRIIHNKLLKAFLHDLKYNPQIYDDTPLKLFNCLNLDLRALKINQRITKITQIDTSQLGKDHNSEWYERRFFELNQFYWSMPGAFSSVRNEAEHGDENIESKNFDFLTQSHVPANTILMCQIATFMIYFCFEILTTWIQTCQSIEIIDTKKA